MNLSPSHERFLATLPPGEAVVFAEGRELACHLAMPNTSLRMRSTAAVPVKLEVVQHMRTRFPQMPPTADEACSTTKPATPPCIPPCPGCTAGDCTVRSTILRAMATENLAPDFQQAIGTGWDALWDFGLSVASRITVKEKAQAAYCLLVNIAAFGRFGQRAIEEMKINLSSHRDRVTAVKQQQEITHA